MSGMVDVLASLAEKAQRGEGGAGGHGHEQPGLIRLADHSVKVIAPVVIAASRYIDVQKGADQLNALVKTTLAKAYRDADTVLSTAGLLPDTAEPWLLRHLRGELVVEITSGIGRNNGHATSTDTQYLMPLVDHVASVQESGQASQYVLPFMGRPFLRDAELARACSRVMMEYQRFAYFHSVAHQVVDYTRDTLEERVGATIAGLTEDFKLGEDEQAYLEIILLRQAGEVMASCWHGGVNAVRDALAALPPAAAARWRSDGVPLETVYEEFEPQYQGVELAMRSALETMMDERLQAAENAQADPKAALARLILEAKTLSQSPDVISDAIRAVSNGIKVLAPILIASGMEDPMGERTDQLNTLVRETMLKATRDSDEYLRRIGVDPSASPVWLTSHVRGVMTQAVARSMAGADALDTQEYLDAFTEHAEKAGGVDSRCYDLPFSVSHPLRMSGALSQACSRVMMEYQGFSYFHPDARVVARQVSDKIKQRAYGALAHFRETYKLNSEEANYLGVTLLHHAGEIYASNWASNVMRCNVELDAMSESELRAVRATGYPLDGIEQDFDALFSGVEMSVRSGLEAMMNAKMTQGPALSQGPRMG